MRAVIIGCGPSGAGRGGSHSISYAHGWAMRKAGLKLVGAASRHQKNLDDFETEFPGISGYQDYRVMLEKLRPEFVSICAFPPDREAMVMAALEAGAKIIWVEKPFATSLGAAHRMIAEAEARGARLFVNFQRRYGRPFEWVKEVVASGRIGRWTGAQIVQPWNQLIDFGPHLIDTVLHTLDVPAKRQPVAVLAGLEWSAGEYQGVPVEEQIVGTVRFSDGTRLTIEAGKEAAELAPLIRFDGEHGFAELRLAPLDGEIGMARGHFRGEAEVSVLETEENIHHGRVDTNLYIDRALEDILQATSTGKSSRIDALAVLPGLEILLALFESARRRKMLELPLVSQDTPFVRPALHGSGS